MPLILRRWPQPFPEWPKFCKLWTPTGKNKLFLPIVIKYISTNPVELAGTICKIEVGSGIRNSLMDTCDVCGTVPNNSYRFWADLLHKWSFLKVRKFRKDFWYPRILPKNERTNSFLLLRRIRSFVFWENSRITKSHFEIIWPLVESIYLSGN